MGNTHAHHDGHGHGGGDGNGTTDRRRLALTLGLAAAYMIAEIVGGLVTGSLALLADAGHMATDVSSLALSLFAIWFATRPAGPQSTFGHRRVEILAALVNGIALIAIAFTIFVEAIQRFGAPPEVAGLPMLAIATGGLLVNLAGLWLLSGGERGSLNVRGAWLHVLADALGSVGAMVAGVLIWAFGWSIADPIASVAIGCLVVYSSWSLLADVVDVLMEKAPRDIRVEDVRQALCELDGVEAVHDLHVWTVTSGLVSLSCHVTAAGAWPRDEHLAHIQALLRERFSIRHSTIQIGPEPNDDCSTCA